MDRLTTDALKKLIEQQGPTLSLFLPTHQKVDEPVTDPLTYKNLLKEGEKQLTDWGVSAPQRRKLLEQAWQLESDRDFWKHQQQGLAVFLEVPHGKLQTFALPYPVRPQAVISDRPLVKPLMSYFTQDQPYFLLGLSLKGCRLYRGSRDTFTAMQVPGMPENLESFLQWDPEKSLQLHTGTADRGPRGRSAIFHGHGNEKDNSDEHLKHYFRQVDRATCGLVHGEPHTPFVLCGVERHVGLYRSLSDSSQLLSLSVEGSLDQLSEEKLHEQSFAIASKHREQQQQHRYDEVQEKLAQGQGSHDIRETAWASAQGHVDTVFLPHDADCWGTMDSMGQAQPHATRQAGDSELLGCIATQTYTHGGEVCLIDKGRLPANTLVMASFRPSLGKEQRQQLFG